MNYDARETGLPTNVRQMRRDVRDFAREVFRPSGRSLDRMADPAAMIERGSPLWSALASAYERGSHAAGIAKQYGGLGCSGLELAVLYEELGWGSADLALSLVAAGVPFMAVAATGDVSLIETFVRPFAADSHSALIGCWAVTEGERGSDQIAVGTEQFHDREVRGAAAGRRDDQQYVISGSKAPWVSNGAIATHALVHMSLAPELGMSGGGIAFVPLELAGIERGAPFNKLGQRGHVQGSLSFRDVRIPSRYVLNGPATYEWMLTRTLGFLDASLAAVMTGLAQAAYEEALVYVRRREQGGGRLSEHQLVQKEIFEIYSKVQASRALAREALRRYDTELSFEYAAAAKVYCSRAAFEAANSAVQLLGARGLTDDFLAAKLLRDARVGLIEYGTNEVIGLAAARQILVREAPVIEAGRRGEAKEGDAQE